MTTASRAAAATHPTTITAIPAGEEANGVVLDCTPLAKLGVVVVLLVVDVVDVEVDVEVDVLVLVGSLVVVVVLACCTVTCNRQIQKSYALLET